MPADAPFDLEADRRQRRINHQPTGDDAPSVRQPGEPRPPTRLELAKRRWKKRRELQDRIEAELKAQVDAVIHDLQVYKREIPAVVPRLVHDAERRSSGYRSAPFLEARRQPDHGDPVGGDAAAADRIYAGRIRELQSSLARTAISLIEVVEESRATIGDLDVERCAACGRPERKRRFGLCQACYRRERRAPGGPEHRRAS